MLDDAERPAGEICRLLKAEGTALGLSTVYRVLAGVRATIPAALPFRFEGVAGEFAQFDFGEVSARLEDPTPHLPAAALRCSESHSTSASLLRAGCGRECA